MGERAVIRPQNVLCILSKPVSLFPEIFVISFLFFSIETTGVESHSNIPQNKPNLQLTETLYIPCVILQHCTALPSRLNDLLSRMKHKYHTFGATELLSFSQDSQFTVSFFCSLDYRSISLTTGNTFT